MMHKTKNRAAFTLIELLAAMAVLSIMMLMFANIFSSSGKAWTSGTRRTEQNMNGRAVLEYMGKEIGQAKRDGRDADEIQARARALGDELVADEQQLRDLMDPGMPGRNWNDATAMVITGKAGMQVMGDWAKGEFLGANQTAGKDYGCVVPGAGGYVMGGDVFVFPKLKDADGQKAQAKLANLMFDPKVQIAFNIKKGSIPVRTDANGAGMDVCAQQGIAAVKDASKQLPSTSYLISPDENGALNDVITEYLNTPNETADDFVGKFAAAVKSAG